jgi:amino acid adenylation domain-containing protein
LSSELLQKFGEIVRIFGSKTAVIYNDRNYSYTYLDKASDLCCNYLKNVYLPDEKIVPFIMDRSVDTIILLLGIMKSNRGFVPIDSSLPINRIKDMCIENGFTKIISKNSFIEIYGQDIKEFKFYEFCLEKIKSYPHIKYNKQLENEIMYIMFTSGTSGKPKGVCISKSSFNNFFTSICNSIELTDDKSILAITSFSFDIFLLEIVVPLLKGMTIILADEVQKKNPKIISKLIVKYNINIIQMTPTLLNIFLDTTDIKECFNNIHDLLIGGEIFPEHLLLKLNNFTKCNIYNLYGPTEATIWCSFKKLNNSNEITVGKPLDGNYIYVMNDEKKLQEIDIPGEIYIAGRQISMGYLNNEELTKSKFIKNPFNPNTFMYSTGDIGKYTYSGEVKVIGRIDNQVKIRGHRVELEEIEFYMQKFPNITNVVVDKVVEKQELTLIAYYESSTKIEKTSLFRFLKKYLPEYMMPAVLIRLDKIPLNYNGKINRKILGNCEQSFSYIENNHSKNHYEDEIGNKIKNIISKIVVGNKYLNIEIENDSLFEVIGLHSIALVKTIIAIESAFEIEFNDEDLFLSKFEKVEDLINYVKNKMVIKSE